MQWAWSLETPPRRRGIHGMTKRWWCRAQFEGLSQASSAWFVWGSEAFNSELRNSLVLSWYFALSLRLVRTLVHEHLSAREMSSSIGHNLPGVTIWNLDDLAIPTDRGGYSVTLRGVSTNTLMYVKLGDLDIAHIPANLAVMSCFAEPDNIYHAMVDVRRDEEGPPLFTKQPEEGLDPWTAHLRAQWIGRLCERLTDDMLKEMPEECAQLFS